jgi:hypothetical protein
MYERVDGNLLSQGRIIEEYERAMRLRLFT